MPELNLRQYSDDIWAIVRDGINRKIIDVGEATRFIDLRDAPTSYSGKAGYKVVVNAAEDGLEFVP